MVMPYVEAAKCTFVTLIDQQNRLSELFGFKAVPNVVVINEDGTIAGKQFGNFDIRRASDFAMLSDWLRSGPANNKDSPDNKETAIETHNYAIMLFQEGMKQVEDNNVNEAMRLWRLAVDVDPSNYVIRKQIWAIENPEKFYDEDVDYAWQNDQLKKGQ